MSVLSIIRAAGWPIWPLIVASMAALALVVERFISLQPARVMPPRLLEEATQASQSGAPSPEVVNQLEQSCAYGSVLAAGLRALNSNPAIREDELRHTLEGAGRAVAHQLERYLPALATIASAAPLMGLLGTVVGMIEIFGSQNASGGSNPMALALTTRVNGITTQTGSTADMIFDIPTLIAYLSSFMTLNPGDVILTGTPEGLADVKAGDVVETEIEGLGCLVNRIVDDQTFFAQG